MSAARAAPAKKKPGKTLDELRAVHDKKVIIPNRIRAAIAAIAVDGPENWRYDEDLRKLAAVSPPDLRDYREEFAEFWVVMPATSGKKTARIVWFGSKKTAAAWRAEHP